MEDMRESSDNNTKSIKNFMTFLDEFSKPEEPGSKSRRLKKKTKPVARMPDSVPVVES